MWYWYWMNRQFPCLFGLYSITDCSASHWTNRSDCHCVSLCPFFTSNQPKQMAALHSPALLEVFSHCSGVFGFLLWLWKKSLLKMQVDVIWLTANDIRSTEKSLESLCFMITTLSPHVQKFIVERSCQTHPRHRTVSAQWPRRATHHAFPQIDCLCDRNTNKGLSGVGSNDWPPPSPAEGMHAHKLLKAPANLSVTQVKQLCCTLPLTHTHTRTHVHTQPQTTKLVW